VTADYVGTFARGLFGVGDVNGGAGVPAALRPDGRFSTVRLIGNTSSSDYHSLQVTAQQRYRAGLSLSVAYTLATAKDDSTSETFAIFPASINTGGSSASGFQGGGPSAWTDRPRSADWGRMAGVSRHAFVASHVLDLPFGDGRRWLSSAPTFIRALAGGWTLASIVHVRCGEAVDLRLGSDANDDGDSGDRPALLSGSVDDLYTSGGGRTQFLVARDRALQLLGASTDATNPFTVVPRNVLTGPALMFYDVSLRKRAQLRGRVQLAIEINAFNVFNRVNLGAPIATLSDARFGRIVSTATGSNPRQIQLGAKLSF